jgi:signal transduction histidine kinase
MDTQEKEIYSAIIVVVLVIAAALTLFFISIIVQQRRYRRLAQAKINAEITTLENERRRIASDLHDEVGPLLSAIKIQIRHLTPASESDAGLVDKSSRYIDDIIARMREISNDLLPSTLQRKGLAAAVYEFLGKIPPNSGLNISFLCPNDVRLPQDTEVNLYRIIQEVVHNALKHASASTLAIQLLISDKEIRLATEDNGRGFDHREMSHKSGSLGLLNLQSRADVLKGHFTWQSAKGKGTRYLFEIPRPQ